MIIIIMIIIIIRIIIIRIMKKSCNNELLCFLPHGRRCSSGRARRTSDAVMLLLEAIEAMLG